MESVTMILLRKCDLVKKNYAYNSKISHLTFLAQFYI